MKNSTKFVIALLAIIFISGAAILVYSKKDQDIAGDVSQGSQNQPKVLGAATDQNDNQKKILKKISVKEAVDLIEENKGNGGFKIIDVRTEEEFRGGNIEGSINIDFYGNFEAAISGLDKNYKYLVYCQSGNRSKQATEIFSKNNFFEIYELEGGYKAWLINE